ncbi:Retrovirus-related Pol polyprotein [Arachis hypogaea]|nr:Retrovirus-related Pol polyprotein [Arachis hypogaea]
MEDMLYSKDLYDPVEGDESKGTKFDAEWKKLNRKAVVLIRQWLDLSMYPHVDTETNAKKTWNKLKELYERKNVQNKAFLIKKLVNMKYTEGKLMAEHLSIFQEMVKQLKNNEITLNDELQALLLLSSFPDSWKVLVVTLTNSAPNGKLTLAMVKESILNEEARRKERGLMNASSLSEALVL